MLERKRDGNFEKNKKSYDLSDMWCKAILDRRNSKELMNMLGIKESLDRMAKASCMVRSCFEKRR